MTRAPTDATRLIRRIDGGDEAARADLWSLVYDELRRLAAGQMGRERGEHTLQPTALVHEAWLRLVSGKQIEWASRAHFFGVAAEAMRRILVEHARRRGALRRGGDRRRLDLATHVLERLMGDRGTLLDDDLEALDQALSALEATGRHERKCQVVKLRFFAGLTVEDAARALEVSPASVKRDWDFAKAWLGRSMSAAVVPDAGSTGSSA
ncbi:MAG: RNA polymerase subunit sigma [Planctomycetota bacterium]|nr:MAG: RNA polymerase subunit sigma [Planctomycetota bacterium]